MVTKFIGVREFRQNLSGLYKKAQKNKIRYVVLNKNRPIFEVKPLDAKEAGLETLMDSIRRAEEDVKAGRVYSWEQVKKELGL